MRGKDGDETLTFEVEHSIRCLQNPGGWKMLLIAQGRLLSKQH